MKLQGPIVLDYVCMCGTVVLLSPIPNSFSMNLSALYTCVGGIYVVLALK